jgi:hypothetical protein
MNKVFLLILILIVLIILCKYLVESVETFQLVRNDYEDNLIENVKNMDENSIFLLKNDNNNTYLYYDDGKYDYTEDTTLDLANKYNIDNKYKFKLYILGDTRTREGDFSIYPIDNSDVYITLWDNNITIQSQNDSTKEKQIFNLTEPSPPCTKGCNNGGKCVWRRKEAECDDENAVDVMACDCNPNSYGTPESNICWFGKTCSQSVDCEKKVGFDEGSLRSCNSVSPPLKSLKTEQKIDKVCNFKSNWPDNMCTKEYRDTIGSEVEPSKTEPSTTTESEEIPEEKKNPF